MPGGVAVVADSYWIAKNRDLLQVEWENENEEFDMDQLWNGLNQGTQNRGLFSVRKVMLNKALIIQRKSLSRNIEFHLFPIRRSSQLIPQFTL